MIEWSSDPKQSVMSPSTNHTVPCQPWEIFSQRGVAPPAGAEPVGPVRELRLVVRLQDQAQHFLQQLVRPGRQPQRPLLRRVLLGDIGAAHRGPPVALLLER